MQFPESWLRTFCDPALNTQELAELLTMSGLEVEELRPVAPPCHGIVVAEILSAEQHPNADKLRICSVNAGGPEPLQIVCGAPNARVGIKVPLATVGAELPPANVENSDGKPFKINVGKLRGVESFGMLCSARELKLSEEHGGLLELAADAQIGQDIRAHLNLDDTLFTLKLTPNLAHALSVYGIAREVSALTGAPLNLPVIAPVAPTLDDKLPVRIEAADLCGRFSGRVIRGVNTKVQTPAWIVDRLARCGQRSVSPLVDISNYVMFEFGRPSHIFDLDKIHDELVVRWAKPGESLKLLNGNTVALDATVGVVADSQGVESLAGIMGGDATAVSDDTVNIYVEAAFWWPKAVMGRSRKFNFSTDAGHRFERGVDPALTAQHVERISQLILDICGGSCGPLDDQTTQLPARTPVSLRVARASKIIGMPVSQEDCARVFTRLGLSFEESPGVLTVTPPSWRFDMQIEEDLIEEVIRVIGYPNLPATPPLAPVVAKVASEARRSVHALRHSVAARDYFETINFSFVEARWERELAGNEQPIQVLNPIAAPLAVMRTSLLGSLVNTLRYNLARRATRVRLFEIGRVFLRDATVLETDASIAGVAQPMRLAGLAYGPAEQQQWSQRDRLVDFFDVKGDLEALFAPRQLRFVAAEHAALHPGRSARVELDGIAIGVIGELHPKWRQGYELPQGGGAPVLFELDLAATLQREIPAPQAIPRQQAVLRDLAVIVGDSVSHDDLMQTIAGAHDGLIRSAKLFDVFKPAQANADMKDGERSLAVRLELLDDEATLTDERIEQTVAAVIAALSQDLGARLRG